MALTLTHTQHKGRLILFARGNRKMQVLLPAERFSTHHYWNKIKIREIICF